MKFTPYRKLPAFQSIPPEDHFRVYRQTFRILKREDKAFHHRVLGFQLLTLLLFISMLLLNFWKPGSLILLIANGVFALSIIIASFRTQKFINQRINSKLMES